MQNKAVANPAAAAEATRNSEIGGGLVVGGICHGNSGKTAAVFNRVYIQPVAAPRDSAATMKAKVQAQAQAPLAATDVSHYQSGLSIMLHDDLEMEGICPGQYVYRILSRFNS